MAPAANYWFVNYHTPDEFGQAVDYIVNTIKPNIVVHSNSFLFGRFDGTGWFAQKVNQAAAAGILWVNSAGNYRTRHWEGAWSDADGDGSLDVPGEGNAFRFDLAATNRPACDISWAGATSDPGSYYSMVLYASRPDDAGAGQEERPADPVDRAQPLPDPMPTCPGFPLLARALLPGGQADRHPADDRPDDLLPHGHGAERAGDRVELPPLAMRQARSPSVPSTPPRCSPSRTPPRARPTTAASSPRSRRPRTC